MTENQGINNSSRAEERARKFVEQEGYTFPCFLIRMIPYGLYIVRGYTGKLHDEQGWHSKIPEAGAFLSLQEMEDFAAAWEQAASKSGGVVFEALNCTGDQYNENPAEDLKIDDLQFRGLKIIQNTRKFFLGQMPCCCPILQESEKGTG